jgi:hypothetical protein
MDLHTWLDAPENAGKAAWLAEQLERSKAAVSLWREAGVPLEHMPRIQELTAGAVTIDDMVSHKLALIAAQAAKPKKAAV